VAQTSKLAGTILFAHGSRDALWRKPVEAVALRVKRLDPARQVACAYLELTEPDIFSCTQRLVDQGVQSITVVPLFLGVGKHAREDLPVLLDKLIVLYPAIQFTLQPAIGEDDRVIELIAKIALT
jgi:sirohydrochlorin cobaltochelatase